MNNFETWEDKYWNSDEIELYKYFSKIDLENLEKLGIHIDNKLYTQREYELINSKIFEYYKENKKGILIPGKELSDTDVSFNDYKKLLEIFNKISADYKL